MVSFDIIDIVLIIALLSLIPIIWFIIVKYKKIIRENGAIDPPTTVQIIENGMKKGQFFFIAFSILTFLIGIYSVCVVFFENTLSVQNFVFFLVINSLSVFWSNACLLGLVLLTTYLYYAYLGYDLKIQLFGINFALFSYIGFLILITGALMFNLTPVDNSNITLESTTITNISFISPNLTDPQNFTLLSSFTLTNFTKTNNKNSSLANQTLNENQGLQKVNSGIFGNALGMVGLALALFALGFTSYDKIQTKNTEEKILLRLENREYRLKDYQSKLTADQLTIIGMCWIISSIIIGLLISIIIKIMPFLLTLAIMVSGMIIEIVGLIIIFYSYYESKKPLVEPESYTFSELIQKINDESKLKK
jgi:hypothetical protein